MTRPQAQVYWFTGLSGAGKSTIAEGVCRHLEEDGIRVLVLDGDDIRKRLHRHLGFSEAEIKENNALVAGLCRDSRRDHGVILVPIISPYAVSRRDAGAMLDSGFFEVYCKADLQVVLKRDIKGLYAKARNGEIDNMIGLSPEAPYEAPENPDLTLETDSEKPEASISRLYDFVRENLSAPSTRTQDLP